MSAQHGAGPPRRPARSAQGHLQYGGPRPGAEHVFGSQRNFARFLARNATLPPDRQSGWCLARSTQFGDIYAFQITGDPRWMPFRCRSAFSAAAAPRIAVSRRTRRARAIPPPDFRWAARRCCSIRPELRFPLIGDNIGGVLFHDMGNIYSSLDKTLVPREAARPATEDFDYMVHAVGFGLRYRTPDRTGARRSGFSINPPTFFGFKGTQQDLINAGRESLPRPQRRSLPVRPPERQPLPVLLLHRTNLLRRNSHPRGRCCSSRRLCA